MVATTPGVTTSIDPDYSGGPTPPAHSYLMGGKTMKDGKMEPGRGLKRGVAGTLALLLMGSVLAACDPKQPDSPGPGDPQQPSQPGMQNGGDPAGGGSAGGAGGYGEGQQ